VHSKSRNIYPELQQVLRAEKQNRLDTRTGQTTNNAMLNILKCWNQSRQTVGDSVFAVFSSIRYVL
jgi:hypothetical protein